MPKQENLTDSVINSQLPDKQRRLIPFIVSAHTVEQACREAGITATTYYEYLKSPAFSLELKKARDSAVFEAMETLKNATSKAVTELVSLLDSKDENVRRRASVDILSFVTKWREFNEIEDRLVKIERIIVERRTYRQ
jgi:hypothetical protein